MKTPSADDPTPRLLTVTQAAIVLGCSRANVYSLIESGALAVISVGTSRGYRIDAHDIEAFIQQRKFRKTSEKPTTPVSRVKLKHLKL